jgi:outer membrane biosynthesis protein TonB
MKLRSGKRIGQSGSELTVTVFFSFIIHVLIVFAAVSLYIVKVPKVPPPFYQVKLVGLPADLSPPLQEVSAPLPPKEEPAPQKNKASTKAKKAVSKTIKAAPKKGALPELSQQQKPALAEEKPAEKPADQAPAGSPVAVTTPQQDFKFSWYLVLVRDKIGQNWRPPPDAKDAKARLVFAVNRSGWVSEVNLDNEHSTGTFGFKQAAIRAVRASNPFPPLPEDFSKQSLEFSVDLMAEQ